jgi:hypothetical protein
VLPIGQAGPHNLWNLPQFLGHAKGSSPVFIFLCCGSSISLAQSVSPQPGDLNLLPDQLGVNFTTLGVPLSGMSIAIGDQNSGGLSYRLRPDIINPIYFGSNMDMYVLPFSSSGFGIPFTSDGKGEYYNFSTSQPTFMPDGSTLSLTPSVNPINFVHTSNNGTISSTSYTNNCASNSGLPKYNGITEFEKLIYGSTILKPNGEKISYYYLTIYNSSGCAIAHRLQSIKSNRGYAIHFDYQTNDNKSLDWRTPSIVTVFNSTVDFCDDTAISCVFTQNWPKLLVNKSIDASSNIQVVVTEPDGGVYSLLRTYSYTLTLNRNGAELIRYNFANNGGAGAFPGWIVQSVSRAGEMWTYSSSPIGSVPTVSRTSPLGGVRSAVIDPLSRNVKKFTDENNRVTNYLYTSNYLLQYVVPPEGTLDANGNPIAGYTKYDYDARGNVVQTTIVPKQGSGLANVMTYAGFDTTCSNRKTCNQPNWEKDGKGNQTDFTYDPTHGGLLTEMRPAPSAGAARPMKVNTYAQRSAWIKNSSGTLVQSPDPVWLIASSTECQTAAGSNTPVCDAAAPQKITTYQYGASGTGEAMLVKGVAVASSGTTLRTCYGYDIFHRRISETKPNANLAVCP